MKILKFLIALFCALFCVRVSAQSLACHNVISGVVLDDSTHLPVADVGVVIIQTQDGIITDSTGAFMFTGLCKKQYTIGLSHLGSNTVQVSINLKRDTTLALLLHKEGF